MPANHSIGYIPLLRNNRSFRNLWYGQVISELGDWLNSIAIYALVLKFSGSGTAMAAAMVAKLLPIFFVSPFAGVVIDRVSRKGIMIASDILRFLIVLCFLLVEGKEDLWMVYTLIVLEISMAGFFEPARSAIIPSIIPKQDLVTANALSGSTWSVMLAFGAALGGLVVSLLGIQMAFILDALTFLVSAWFISRISSPPNKSPEERKGDGKSWSADLAEVIRYLVSEPIVLVLALLKSGLAVAGGIMTLIPLYAHHLLTSPAAISMWIGIMYSSRGIGAALGPILVKRFFGDSARVLHVSIGAGFFLGAASYVLLGNTTNLWVASASIGLATMFGSVIWVFSSALIHIQGKERFLGRIFGFELGLLTLVMAASNWGVGLAMDRSGVTLGNVSYWMGGCLLVPGVLWCGFLLFVHRRLKQGKSIGSVCPVDPSGFNPFPAPPVKKD